MKKGFTIIELLIVVSILGILSGITLTVIDTGKQRARAEDAVKRSNIEKLAQAIQAHCNAEAKCPALKTDGSRQPNSPTYISAWPTDDTSYTYVRNGDYNFEVNVRSSLDPAKYIKYNSLVGKIEVCTTVSVYTGTTGDAVTWTTTCGI